LILIFNLVNLKTIVVEENSVLRINAIAKIISLEDSLELSKQLERVFNTGDDFEILVNITLEFCFH
jgi:hypothetical protein